MITPDATMLAASQLSRARAGLSGGCGCTHGAMAGPGVVDYKLAALEAGTAVLASDGDVKAAFAPVLSTAAKLSLALPPPWSIVTGALAQASAEGVQAIRNQMAHAVTGAGKYLPVQIAKGVVADLESNWGTSWRAAGKDKLVRYIVSPDDGAPDSLTGSLKLANAALPADDRLDLEVATRLAQRVYELAKGRGAADYQAAAAALYGLHQLMYKPGGASYKGLGAKTYAFRDDLLLKKLGAKPGESVQQAFDRVSKEKGLVKVTEADLEKAKDKAKAPRPAASGGVAVPLLAAGAVALLLTR